MTELNALYAPEKVELSIYTDSINDADEVVSLMKRFDCGDIVAVLPLPLMAELTSKGIAPLRAVMGRVVNKRGKTDFSHYHFERVLKVDVTTQEAKPLSWAGKPWKVKRV